MKRQRAIEKCDLCGGVISEGSVVVPIEGSNWRVKHDSLELCIISLRHQIKSLDDDVSPIRRIG